MTYGVHQYYVVPGSKRISFYTRVKSTNHVACVMRNGHMNVPQDTPGKATVCLQKEQNQRLKSLIRTSVTINPSLLDLVYLLNK